MPQTAPVSSRPFPFSGALAMVVGLGFVVFELVTNLMLDRMGPASQALIFIVGTSLSIWGLKEILTTLWPWLGQRGRRFRVPKEGVVYLIIMIVLLIGSLIGRSNTLMMVFALMIGPLLMNGNMAFVMLQKLGIRRELPKRVMAGDPFTVSLLMENRKRLFSAWVMQVRDLVRHGAGVLMPEVVFMRVPAGKELRGHYEMRLHERGEYEFGPITIDTRFPLGLIERGIRLPVTGKLLVYPRIGHMRPGWRQRVMNASELVTHVRPQPGAFNDEMHRLREYRTGDDPRMIHWRTSARMNDLMVKVYRESRDHHLFVLVDAWADSPEREREAERLFRFAATLCLEQLKNSRETALEVELLGQESQLWSGEISDSPLEHLLDEFARIQTTDRITIDALIHRVREQRSLGRRILILTPRAEELRRRCQDPVVTEQFGTETQIIGTSLEELELLYDDGETDR